MNVRPGVTTDILVKSGCCTLLLMIVSKLCISLTVQAGKECIVKKQHNLGTYSGDCDSVALNLQL